MGIQIKESNIKRALVMSLSYGDTFTESGSYYLVTEKGAFCLETGTPYQGATDDTVELVELELRRK